MTRRRSLSKKGFYRTVLMLAGLLAIGVGARVRADAFSYAGQRRQIKACVLVSNAAVTTTMSGLVPENAVPYLFYVLDRRLDTKPAGWEFVNPLAPTTITADIYTRWQNRQAIPGQDPAFVSGSAQSQLFHVGAPLTKNIGAYWEVNLDNISADDLQQFDVVLMAYHNGAAAGFTPDEREKLRRYVDAGGTLWLEDEGGYNIGANAGQFIVNVAFNSALTGTPALVNPLHPLVNFPYRLTGLDVARLGIGAAPSRHLHSDPINGPVAPNIVVPVLQEGGLGYVSAGDDGAGRLIVSSAGVATDVNSYVGGVNVASEGGNSGAVSGENMAAVLPTDLKFAYNLVAWSNSTATANAGARRASATSEALGGDLGIKWATVPPAALNAGYGTGAVIDKGAVFAVDGANVLHAFNAAPGTDLDNDRNPDEGLPDYILGTPYDEIWNVDLTTLGTSTSATTRVSTPTIASIYDTSAGRWRDILVVENTVGVTMAFDAFPLTNGVLAASNSPLWKAGSPGQDYGPNLFWGGGTNQTPVPAPSPAFSEGVLFTLVYDLARDPAASWHVAPLDPLIGSNVFGGTTYPGIAPAPPNDNPADPTGGVGLFSPTGPLTVGYVRDSVTGALDKMIFVPTGSLANAGGGTVTEGAINGIWFSTRNEPLIATDNTQQNFEPTGNRAMIPWWAPAIPGADPYHLLPVLHVVLKNPATGVTTPVTDLRYPNGFTVQYNGTTGSRRMEVNLSTPLGPNEFVYADYTADWPDEQVGNSAPQPNNLELARIGGVMPSFARHLDVFSPNIQNTPVFINGSMALTPQDLLVFNAGDYKNPNPVGPPEGDRIYAYHDQAQIGQDAAGHPLLQVPQYAWMFAPNDEISTTASDGSISATLKPRIVNNYDYSALGVAQNQGFNDFEVVGGPAYANGAVYVVGYAHQQSAAGTLPDSTIILALNAAPNTDINVGQALPQGTRQVTLWQVDPLQSTASNLVRVQWTEPLAPARTDARFTVDVANGTIHILNFNTSNGAFDTALPFYVQADQNPPILVQNPNTGYGPLDNLLWYMIIPQSLFPHPASGPAVSGNTLYFGTQTGQITAVDLPTGTTSGQVNIFNADGTLRVHVLGIQSNLGQTISQPIIHPPVAARGMVAVGAPNGIAAMDNQVTLITDNRRLLEVDHGVNALLSVDSTTSLGVAGGPLIDISGNPSSGQIVGTKVALARPNVARNIALNQFMVADTGNNRVIQVDAGGFIDYELHNVVDDMKFLRPNDPVSLNRPTDAELYTEGNTTGLSFTNPDTGVTFSYTGSYLANHYLIADDGNFRILEVVDAYDPNGQPIVMTGSDGSSVTMQKQVVFVTRTTSQQNQSYSYRTAQLFERQDPNNTSQIDTFMATAIDNVRPATIPASLGIGSNGSPEGLGSALMLFYRYPPSGATFTDGQVYSIITNLTFEDASGNILRQQAISNPTFLQEYDGVDNNGNPTPHYLLCDDNGCYDLIVVPTNGATPSQAVVQWTLSANDYRAMTGRTLRAASIQKLGQADYYSGTNKFYPRYLITNRYEGKDGLASFWQNVLVGNVTVNVVDGDVHGEVFEIRSIDYYANQGTYQGELLYAKDVATGNPILNLGTSNGPITWMVPKETLTTKTDPVTNTPYWYIKRSIGAINGGTSTYLLEQPTFSSRP
ncbi:MAG TPA: PQQ-binding-like beta-propeller repeat protein [Chthonomonadaceae bacterium]|nr:PQQ-binding-like beta-propeller repeat protein [Chthonomonadaceae bacterium]